MKTLLDTLQNRHSVRAFLNKEVPERELTKILDTARQAPSSINSQQVSLIVTKDRKRISQIADLAGGQPQVAAAPVFITVVVDQNRTFEACDRHGVTQVLEQSAEGIIAATLDAGIIVQALLTAANAMGYGGCAIGGVRNDPDGMVSLLQLPKRTFPVVGVTIGVEDPERRAKTKPRLAHDAVVMRDVYDAEAVRDGIEPYDLIMKAWWRAQNLERASYSESVAKMYGRVYYPSVGRVLMAQGFRFKMP